MGGKIRPPNRPGHIDKYEILTVERDNFMMDFENECLSQRWDNSKRQHPTGPKRHEDTEWATMIQSQAYPDHADVDWEEYTEWVSRGHGDEWFQEEKEEEEVLFCKKHKEGPLDVWYDCDACVQEVRGGPAPCDCRYTWMPLSSITRTGNLV